MRPFGRRGGKYTFCKKRIELNILCPQIGNICKLNIHVGIGYIMPTLGRIYVGWRLPVRPSGAGVRNIHFVTYKFLSHTFCQKIGNICKLNIYVDIGLTALTI